MRKTDTIIDDKVVQISVNKDQALIDKKKYNITQRNSQLLIKSNDGKEYFIDDLIFISENIIRVEIEGYTIDVEIQNPLDKAIMGDEESQLNVISPLAGIVSQILIKEGDEINKGQVLIIISAMKMENKIVSKSIGKVKCINIKINDQVNQGSVLVELENK